MQAAIYLDNIVANMLVLGGMELRTAAKSNQRDDSMMSPRQSLFKVLHASCSNIKQTSDFIC